MTPAPEDPAPPPAPDPPEPAPDSYAADQHEQASYTYATAPQSSPSRPSPAVALSAVGLAVLVVLALVGAWHTLQSHRDRTAALVSVNPGVAPPIPTLTPHPTGSAPTPSAHPSPTAHGTPTATPTPAPTKSAPAKIVVDRSIPVVVLNATTRTGLAAREARSLRSLGWTVVSVGNWRGGGVNRTTVFAIGYAVAARTLRADVGASAPVRAPLPSMARNRLVLVIGPDYKG
ncbi:MAG TPA: LytR C-terminal domain-containing protein [Candidatus Nanopelagicales bacterium]